MKILVYILSLIGIFSEALGQFNSPIEDSDSTEYLFIVDTDTLLQINYGFYKPRFHSKRQRLLYVNGNVIDSTGLRFEALPIFDSQELVGYARDEQMQGQQLRFDWKSHNIIVVNASKIKFSNSVYPYGIFNRGDTLSTQIVKVEKDGKIFLLENLSEVLGIQNPPGIPEEIIRIIPLQSDLLIETGYCDGGCYSFRYFLLRTDLKLLNFTPLYKENFNESYDYDHFRVNFYFSHPKYNFLMAAVDYGNLPVNTDLIFSEDLKDTTYIIKKNMPWEIIGENIQDGNNVNFYVRSILDNKEKVILPYKIDKEFERISYKLFKGHSIDKSALKLFDKMQLSILKNLIFAKHNYAFNSEFYQSYFNHFDFYNTDEMLSSRTKDVNDKLTDTDKKNLALINKYLN